MTTKPFVHASIIQNAASLTDGCENSMVASTQLFENKCSLEMDVGQEWLTTEAAAAYLSLSVGSLRNITSNGFVPYYKLGRRNRYRLIDLRDLLLSQRRGF